MGQFLSVEQEAIVGNVINKLLLLLNEHGDPSFLFQNLISYNANNQ